MDQPGQCRMLLVFSHGYATAGLSPGTGGQMEVVTSDWVDATLRGSSLTPGCIVERRCVRITATLMDAAHLKWAEKKLSL